MAHAKIAAVTKDLEDWKELIISTVYKERMDCNGIVKQCRSIRMEVAVPELS